MANTYDQLIKNLNYIFQNADLLKIALTHRSKGFDHNERLEFLGDAVVNFVVAEVLYLQFPHATEGELSRWRATLVNRETLGDLALKFDLGRYIYLGAGELRSGGNQRQSILSCAMEAIIGAVYLDGGFAAVREKIIEWYGTGLTALSDTVTHKDPKTILQEYLQSHRLPLPLYTVEDIEGAAHKQLFIVACQVQKNKTLGRGTSRRRAEQQAAQAMLEILLK